jgi:hypothetical protein
LHCEMVGALVLSRSVAQAAPALSNKILENVQRQVYSHLSSSVRATLPNRERDSRQTASGASVSLRRPRLGSTAQRAVFTRVSRINGGARVQDRSEKRGWPDGRTNQQSPHPYGLSRPAGLGYLNYGERTQSILTSC